MDEPQIPHRWQAGDTFEMTTEMAMKFWNGETSMRLMPGDIVIYLGCCKSRSRYMVKRLFDCFGVQCEADDINLQSVMRFVEKPKRKDR